MTSAIACARSVTRTPSGRTVVVYFDSHAGMWALGKIEESRPDTILLGYRGLMGVHAESAAGKAEAWADGVSASVRRLLRISPRVTVISDVATLAFGPRVASPTPTPRWPRVWDRRTPHLSVSRVNAVAPELGRRLRLPRS